MHFRLSAVQFHVLPMRTRFPFQYGIASMQALPHLFTTVTIEHENGETRGLASEGLPPKWFTKNPDTSFEQDLAEMLAVIQNAARISRNAAEQPTRYFAWWQDVETEQIRWAKERGVPHLLAHLGVSLMERAVLDALAKASGRPLHELIHSGALDLDLGSVHAELRGVKTTHFLPSAPLSRLTVRHTIGLADPLHESEATLNDGLPQALDQAIRYYGLNHFKIKISGRPEADTARLRAITAVLTTECQEGFRITLDGNEQFQDMAQFRDFYRNLVADSSLTPLTNSLLFVEQPLHRDRSLDAHVADVLRDWPDAPPIIIDEADGALGDLSRALELGYRGASHKNCKGIVKGLANAALLRQRSTPAHPMIHSGEDLANVGPVALLQDLAMMALLGVGHVERNGHHYFRGLSMLPNNVQEAVLATHGDLYRLHAGGFPTLHIHAGTLALDSVNAAPFGCAAHLDATTLFQPLNDWIKQGGLATL